MRRRLPLLELASALDICGEAMPGLPVPAQARRALDRVSATYATGTRKRVSTSELARPPMITEPIALRISAPAVNPRAKGSIPAIMARVVITIGRKRAEAAARIASTAERPADRIVFA